MSTETIGVSHEYSEFVALGEDGLALRAQLGTGSQDSSHFLNGLGQWAVPAGGGGGGGLTNLDGGDASAVYGATTPIDGGGA